MGQPGGDLDTLFRAGLKKAGWVRASNPSRDETARWMGHPRPKVVLLGEPAFSSSESTNSAAEPSRSLIFSPTPTKRTGRLSSRAMATAMPPLAVPSSLVSTNAGDSGGLREEPRLLQAILPGRRVHHQQNFVRRAGDQPGGSAAHLVQLVHQAGFGVQAAGGVDVKIVDRRATWRRRSRRKAPPQDRRPAAS